jgi:hypothetical protein
MPEVISNGIGFLVASNLVEVEELFSLYKTISVLILVLEHFDDPLVASAGQLASAPLNKSTACFFCHLGVLIRVEVEPFIEDFSGALCELPRGVHQRSVWDLFNDIDLLCS